MKKIYIYSEFWKNSSIYTFIHLVDLLQYTKYFKSELLPCLYIWKKAKLGSAESFICKNSRTSEKRNLNTSEPYRTPSTKLCFIWELSKGHIFEKMRSTSRVKSTFNKPHGSTQTIRKKQNQKLMKHLNTTTGREPKRTQNTTGISSRKTLASSSCVLNSKCGTRNVWLFTKCVIRPKTA